MSDNKQPATNLDDAELERRIRSERKFSLAEAIGRSAGGDLMKGASPVSCKRQAELQLADYLQRHLVDAERALELVLLRRVGDSASLLQMGYADPLRALLQVIDHLLATEPRLQEFVREVDMEWGRINDERPHFQIAGRPPSQHDPYTEASVRTKLQGLLEKLHTEGV